MKHVPALSSPLLVFSALVGLSVAAPRSAHSTLPPRLQARQATRRAAAPEISLTRLPLQFEANQGQTDPRVRFLSRGPGYTLFLTDTDAVLSVSTRVKPAERGALHHMKTPCLPEDRGTFKRTVVKMSVGGARKGAAPVGLEELPGKVNYLHGRDSQKWQQHVPTFRKVRQNGVYPGVDLVYYGSGGRLEYDFVVQPGADPRQIRLSYAGADRVEVAKDGDLVLHTGAGELRQHKPLIYQEVDGRQRLVDGRFSILAEAGPQKTASEAARLTQVAFNVAAYDTTRPLVIDPEVIFSTYLGCEGYDRVEAVAVDTEGNPIITGQAGTADFPVTVGTVNQAFGGGGDAFVAKLSADGTRLLFSTFLGGTKGVGTSTAYGSGNAVAVDAFGNTYVGGESSFVDFPVIGGAQTTFGGKGDAFVAELNADGSRLLYSTLLGGPSQDRVLGLALDPAANIYVTGSTIGGFPLKYPIRLNCDRGDAFVARINPALSGGASVVYSTYLGGSGEDSGSAIAVDGQGFAYVTGQTRSLDFPQKNPVPDSTTRNATTIASAFLTKLTPAGDALVYSTYLADKSLTGDRTRPSAGHAIAVDASGGAYVVGETSATRVATSSAAQYSLPRGDTSTNPFTAAFAAKVAPGGGSLEYATYLGGGRSGYESDVASGIAVDAAGIAYVTGTTKSTNFPKVDGLGAPYDTLLGSGDVFLTAISAEGRKFLYSFPLGGTHSDNGAGIALGPNHSVFLVGSTQSSDFPLVNPIHPQFGGNTDGFIARITVPGFSTLEVTASDGAQHPFTLTGDPRTNGGHLAPTSVATSTESTVVLSATGTNGAVVSGFTVDGVPTAGDFFPGGRRITLSMAQSHTVRIAYSQPPTVTLTVGSTNPASGVAIGLQPADNDGHTSGTTSFTSTYLKNASSTAALSAPATAPNGNTFGGWLLDGQPAGSANPLSVSLGANHTVTAVYVTPPSVLTVNSSNPDSGVQVRVNVADQNGQTDGTTPFSRAYARATNIGISFHAPATAPNGNVFKQWLVDGRPGSDTTSLTVGIEANHTITAVYQQPAPVTIKVQSATPASGVSIQVSGGTPATGSTTFNVIARAGIPLTLTAPATASNGNVFVRWDLPGGATSTNRVATFTPTAAGTATAVYATPAPSLALTVQSKNPDSGVTIQVETPAGTAASSTTFQKSLPTGTTVTLQAPASAPNGNVFQNWQDGNGTALSTSPRLTFTLTAARTVVAAYKSVTTLATLTVSSSNPEKGVKIDGTVSGVSFSGTTTFTKQVAVGAAVTLTAPATASNGNLFRKWQRDGVDLPGATTRAIGFNPDANHTYTAVYGPANATLTLASINPSTGVGIGVQGVVEHTPFQATYPVGTQVALVAADSAIPNLRRASVSPRSQGPPNTQFRKWLRDGNDFSGNTFTHITVTMDASHTYTAVYAFILGVSAAGTTQTAVPVTISLKDRNGDGNGSTPVTRDYDPNAGVTVTAPTTLANGDHFIQWKVDGVLQPAGQRDITLKMDTNHFVEAQYAPS